MALTAIVTGIFFIIIGYVIKAFPNTIAGYNTMSMERKAYVDIEGLSSFIKRGFILMGVVMLIGCSLFQLAGQEKMATGFYSATIIFGVIYIMLSAQAYDSYP